MYKIFTFFVITFTLQNIQCAEIISGTFRHKKLFKSQKMTDANIKKKIPHFREFCSMQKKVGYTLLALVNTVSYIGTKIIK